MDSPKRRSRVNLAVVGRHKLTEKDFLRAFRIDGILRLDLEREMTGDDRVAASKAADRLITIKGIDAAFTLTKAGDNINISARSNGKINVQRLAEKLGGGGHFNMAGALIKEKTLESVSEALKKHIDEYFDAKAAEEQSKKG